MMTRDAPLLLPEAGSGVRTFFWFGVGLLWLCLAVLLLSAALHGLVLAGIWAVPELPPRATTAQVRAIWGEPTLTGADRKDVQFSLGDYHRCAGVAKDVWFYDRTFLPDSFVLLGQDGLVMCAVEARGSYFIMRSY